MGCGEWVVRAENAKALAPRFTASSISRWACSACPAVTNSIGPTLGFNLRTASSNASYFVRWMNIRRTAMQVCPRLNVTPNHAAFTASSRFASASTNMASQPESSIVDGMRRSPSLAASLRPTVSDPVNTMRSTSASANCGPASRVAGSFWKSSAGNPASRKRACSKSAVRGAFSLGFQRTALPATSACAMGPTFR